MFKSSILSLFFVLAAVACFSQTSLNEKTRFWPQGSSWVGGTYPGTLSGGIISVTSKIVVINGTIKSINALDINLSNVSVNAGDTLVVLGNFNINGSGFSNNGVVVVMGNFNNTLSNSSISGSGKLVVTGDYNNSTGANSFAGPSYVYGNTSGFIFSPSVGNHANLIAADPALNNYVNTMFSSMPIELTYFQAEVAGSSVVLSWETASEVNNDYFLVERMKEGDDHFETIATVQGAGNSKEAIQYSYTDYSPISGRSYYRLSQVDFDGTLTHFNIVSALTAEMGITVFPNPTTEYLFFTGAKMNASVFVTDLQGENHAKQFKVQELSAGQLGIDVRELEAGTYSIRISNESSVEQLKFMKR